MGGLSLGASFTDWDQRSTAGGGMYTFHSCNWCGDRIGAWEPAIFVLDVPHSTTQTARPDIAADATERYHRDCYRQLEDRAAAATG